MRVGHGNFLTDELEVISHNLIFWWHHFCPFDHLRHALLITWHSCLGDSTAANSDFFLVDSALVLVNSVDRLGSRVGNVNPHRSLPDRDLLLVNQSDQLVTSFVVHR